MNATHFAVVVGVNRYPAIRDLKKARNDAERFAKWLKDPDGGALPEGNVVPVVVADEEQANPLTRAVARPRLEDVEAALERVWDACEQHVAAHPEDWAKTRLYFYASGHGIEPSPTRPALLLADAGPPHHFSRNVSCDHFLEYFRAAQPFRELVFFADCCREVVTAAQPGRPRWDEVAGNNGEVIFLPGYATTPGHLAFEGQDPQQGLSHFTQALIEGLEGQAARDDGVIDSASLATYVRARVKELSKDQQISQMLADPAAPIVFRRDVAPAAAQAAKTHPIRLLFPAGFAGLVDLRDGGGVSLGQHDAAAGPWQVQLENGLYEAVPAAGGPSPFANEGLFKVVGGGKDVQL